MHLLTCCRKIQRECQLFLKVSEIQTWKEKSDVKALFSCRTFGNLSCQALMCDFVSSFAL